MRITTTRKISQIFFFALFLWLCIVTAVGTDFLQLRAWPVNLFFQFDPLIAITTTLSTHHLYAPLALSVITLALTIVIGRFFCGWVCPFGALHHAISFLSHKRKNAELIAIHKYRKAQNIKYYILLIVLIMAAMSKYGNFQTGLLDPFSLFGRSVNLLLLPVFDNSFNVFSNVDRFYRTAIPILSLFIIFVILNFWIPRFFCLFICPLGALFGIFNRFAIFRINRNSKCTDCKLCNRDCTGNCQPSETIKQSECLMCMNCLDDCKFSAIDFSTVSNKHVQTYPDISRRGLITAAFTGLLAMPAFRLVKSEADSDNILRPPGSLPEKEFMKRCIKCGQCMRLCPTNVIQPLGIEQGLAKLWTPTMNNRIGTSGCQYDCVACGFVCPTAAIRPLTLAEKTGKGKFADSGPVKIGTASIDRSKCIPWAHNTPCIVCQENCPVSPKAIVTRESTTSAFESQKIKSFKDNEITIEENAMPPGKFGSGDYYCHFTSNKKPINAKIVSNTSNTIKIAPENPIDSESVSGEVQILIHLHRPFVNPEDCIGCGICQHECPVAGNSAITVSAYGQTRES